MSTPSYSQEELADHLERTLARSGALRHRRAVRLLGTGGAVALLAIGVFLTLLLVPPGGRPQVDHNRIVVVVTGRVGYRGPVTASLAAEGRIDVASGGRSVLTAPIVNGMFRLHLRPGRYRLSGVLTKPHRDRCPAVELAVPVGRPSVTVNLACVLAQ